MTIANGIAGDIAWLLRAAQAASTDPDEPQIPDTIIWDIDGDEDTSVSKLPKFVTKIVVTGQQDEPRVDLDAAPELMSVTQRERR